MRNASLDSSSWQRNDSEKSPVQSILPGKKHCCRNIRSHGNAEGAATVFSMDMELSYQNKQNARVGLYARLEERLHFAEKNLTAVATLPAAQGLPSVAGRLGRPSRTIATSRQ